MMHTVNMIHASGQGRTERHALRIEGFLDAAERVVVDEGVEALTMARLAKECGAAVGAVYRYLPGKSALLGGLQVRAVRVLGELLEERLLGVADPIERIQLAFGSWSVFSQQSPALFRLIDDSLSDPSPHLDPDDRDQVRQVFTPLLWRCGQLIEEAVEAGALQVGDAQMRTYALWAAVHGAEHVARKIPLPEQAAQPDLGAQMVADLLSGWSPR
jgi:AcrR family transcriptional regulator